MRLKKINIINFGQLSNLSFDLPSRELTVFFGQNEAGKSTTVAFIKQILFGFYLRSNSSPFFEDYKPLSQVSPMGGSLIFIDEDQHEYKLERLWAKGDKTKRGILTVYRDGQEVPESLFFDQIKNIDGAFYADSFIFNQDMLGQIASLSQKDLLERIYYLGAANSAKLLEIRDEFDKKAGQLFKKSGKKPEVNRLLQAVSQKRTDLAKTEEQFADYRNLDQHVQQLKQELSTERQKYKKLSEQLQENKSVASQENNYQTLQQLQHELKAIKFSGENYRQAQELTARRKNLQNDLDHLQTQLQSVTQESNSENDELLDKRSDVLQWEAEYRNCLQTNQKLQQQEEQILQLNPEVKLLIDKNNQQIKRLKDDFAALPEKKEKENTKNHSGKFFLIIGIFVLILAGTQVTNNYLYAAIGMLLGCWISILGFLTDKKQKEKTAAEEKKRQQILQVRDGFQEKYHLNPDQLDLKDLLQQRNNYLLAEQSIEENKTRLRELARLSSRLAGQLAQAVNAAVSPDFHSLLATLSRLNKQSSYLREQEQKRNSLQNSFANSQNELKELNLRLQAVLAKDQVKTMDEYDQRYQDFLAQEKLKAQISALKENLGPAFVALSKMEPGKLKKQDNELASDINSLNEEISALQQELAEYQVKMANLADSTAVFDASQDLADEETEFSNASKDYLANLFAAKWVSRALDLASNERFPKMAAAAKDYFKLLTGGRYVDILLNKKITVVRKDNKKREVKYLSRATAEQLYFALKLAFVEQIKDQINLPILIDDSFVNFDDRRIDYIKELLEKISQNNQVLIFTAQEKLAQSLQIKPLTFEKGNDNA